MKVPSFLRLFGKGRSRGAGRRARPATGEAARRARRTRLLVDTLEDRTLLATLPLPQVLGQQILSSGGHNFMPSVAVIVTASGTTSAASGKSGGIVPGAISRAGAAPRASRDRLRSRSCIRTSRATKPSCGCSSTRRASPPR